MIHNYLLYIVIDLFLWYIVIAKKTNPQRSITMINVSENAYFDENRKQIIGNFLKNHQLFTLLKESGAYKTRGVPVLKVFTFIFSLLFTGKSLFRTLRDTKKPDSVLDKNVVYRFLQSTKTDWIQFTTVLAQRIISQIHPLTGDKRKKVLIIDDSIYDRSRSKKAELLTKVYDHARHAYALGYRLLTIGWSDGNSFIPINFSLLSSKDTEKRLVAQKEVTDPAAVTRRNLAVQKATDTTIHLIEQAKKLGISATHVLFDSWFACPAMILRVYSLGYHTVAMVKRIKTYHYEFNGNMQSVKEIFNQCKKRRGRSRYLLSVSITICGKQGERLPARLVYVRNRNKRNEYLVLLSTDIEMDEDEIIQIYGKRWAVEVFFKVAKSYLRVVKGCSSLSFDTITAHTAIVFAQYMMLSEQQRLSVDNRSIGDLFFFTVDELRDLAFDQALVLILSAIFHAVTESYELSDKEKDILVQAFLSSIPAPLVNRLEFAA